MSLPPAKSTEKRLLLDALFRSDSLRGRVITGSLWATGAFGLGQALRFASNILLARLLAPEAFGLMALVNVVFRGTQMLSDIGIGLNVVQSPRGENPSFLATAWTVQILRGFILTLFCIALARPVASFYEQDQLCWLLVVSSAALLISGWNSTSLLLMTRRMDIQQLSFLEIAAQLAAIAAMLSWAWWRPSVWALVVGSLVGATVNLIASHSVFANRQDHLRWEPEAAREIITFGKWIFVSTALTFLATELDRLIFGKMISIAQLGVYSIAVMIAVIPAEVFQRLGAQIVFPAYSRAQREGRRLDTIYHRLRFPFCSIAGLIVALLAASGDWIIEIVYDTRYLEAGAILRMLAFASWFLVLMTTNGALLLASGAPRLLAMCNAAKVVGLALFIPLGFQVGGLHGAILGIVLAEVMRYAASLVAVGRYGIHVGYRDLAMTGFLVLSAVLSRAAGSLGGEALGTTWMNIPISLLGAIFLWTPLVVRSFRTARADAQSLN